MTRLAVCGCSFSAVDPRNPESEYGYWVAKHFGWDYVNLARPGASNHIIRLQVDEAIQQGVDWVIINWTNSERIEWNYTDRHYGPRTGIKHVTYWDADHLTDSVYHPRGDHDPVITADSLNNIFHKGRIETYQDLANSFRNITHWITPERYEAIKDMFLYLWDDNLVREKDSFLAESACWALERAGISYVTNSVPYAELDDRNLLPSSAREWYDPDNEPLTDQFIYHTTPQQQKEYAEVIVEHIQSQKSPA